MRLRGRLRVPSVLRDWRRSRTADLSLQSIRNQRQCAQPHSRRVKYCIRNSWRKPDQRTLTSTSRRDVFTIQQNGYRAAALAAFLPAFAVLEPVSGSLAGLLVYHERLNAGPGRVMVEMAAYAAAAWGIDRLAARQQQGGPVGAGAVQPTPTAD